MDLDSSPQTRKRGRPLHQKLNGSSPAADVTPLSAAKRRKLDITGSSPSTPKALQALKTVISGVFSFGKIKENVGGTETDSQASKETDGATAVFDEFIDELLAEENQGHNVKASTSYSKRHSANHTKLSENGDPLAKSSKSGRQGKRSRMSVPEADAEIEDDVDELLLEENKAAGINGSRHRSNGFIARQRKVSGDDELPTLNPDPSRKRKRDRMFTTALDADVGEDELSAVVEPTTKKTGGKVGARHTGKSTKQDLKGQTKPPKAGMSTKDTTEELDEASVGEDLSSSASRPSRERRRPRRYSNEMVEVFWPKSRDDTTPSKTLEAGNMPSISKKPGQKSLSTTVKIPAEKSVSTATRKPETTNKSTPTKKLEPKSILTPSRRSRERTRKSVTFGVEHPVPVGQYEDLQDISVGADSVELSTSTKKKRGRTRKQTDADSLLENTTSPVRDFMEDEEGIESRKSRRRNADPVPPKKTTHSPNRESSVEDLSVFESEDTPSKKRNPRHAKEKSNPQSPKQRKRSKVQEYPADDAFALKDDSISRSKGRLRQAKETETHKQTKRRDNPSEETSAAADGIGSDSDDVACVICNGGDSEAPNEILLCDNCDLAAHQVCYGVQVIPEGDWLCRDCCPDEDEELMLVETGSVSEPSLDIEASNIPDIEAFEYHLQVTQKLVLDKLTGQRRLKLYGLDEEYRKVHQVVEQTVLAGEGNSMLVIGARGCGKTTLVESVISDLSKDHREHFHVVRLNGFIHTDDKLALRETWRQLGREMEVEDDLTSKTNNYADTLASLLALLSHPSEISEIEANQTAKSVIFILDEFDLFTSHPRQTLLYNLFDIAQARKAPVAVLGLTTKIDVVERLEKRVKSRFSHRYVHLPLPKSLAVYWEIVRQGLVANIEELLEEGITHALAGWDEFRSFWESMINDLYHKDEIFKQQLQRQFYRNKSVPTFLTSCILPIANLTPNSIPLTGTSFFLTHPTLSPPDSKLHLLSSLAELDLALLIAAARLNIILDTETCNFAMAYDEYSGLTSKHKIQTSSTGVAALGAGTKVWGRDVAIGAWERLVDCELLIPAGIGGASMSAGRDGGRENRMWRVDVGLDEIPGSVEGLSSIMAKWCREI